VHDLPLWEGDLITVQIKRLVFVSIIVLSCCVSLFAQGHSIRGKVRNAAGVNVARSAVTLERNGAMVEQTVTNNEGDFTFTGLTDTSYTVIVTAVDYNPASESVEFVRAAASDQPGELRTVEITLTFKEPVRPSRAGITFVQNIPAPALAAFEAGLKHSRENRPTEAIASYREAIKIFPNYFNANLTLAAELAKQGQLQEAITSLEAARAANPKDDRVYDLFGRVMMQQRKYSVAARIYAEATRLNPAETQYLLARGTALIEQVVVIDGMQSSTATDERSFALTEAERVLLQAVKQNEKLADAHLQLARVYEKKGERTQAAEQLERYLRKAPNAKNAEQIRGAIKKLRQ
jgi:tetratricopeptide (TPR) repeat protein